jgi:hypothetical protein
MMGVVLVLYLNLHFSLSTAYYYSEKLIMKNNIHIPGNVLETVPRKRKGCVQIKLQMNAIQTCPCVRGGGARD